MAPAAGRVAASGAAQTSLPLLLAASALLAPRAVLGGEATCEDTGGDCKVTKCDESRNAVCMETSDYGALSFNSCMCRSGTCAEDGKCPGCSGFTGGVCKMTGCDESRNAICVGNKCVCRYGKCATDGKCDDCISTGEACLDGSCGGENALCVDGKCQCRLGVCATGVNCPKCSADTGGRCKYSWCESSRRAACIGGKCLCRPDMCAVDGKCVSSGDAPQSYCQAAGKGVELRATQIALIGETQDTWTKTDEIFVKHFNGICKERSEDIYLTIEDRVKEVLSNPVPSVLDNHVSVQLEERDAIKNDWSEECVISSERLKRMEEMLALTPGSSIELKYTFGISKNDWVAMTQENTWVGWMASLAAESLCISAFDALGPLGKKARLTGEVMKEVYGRVYDANQMAGNAEMLHTEALRSVLGGAPPELVYKMVDSLEFCIFDLTSKDRAFYEVTFEVRQACKTTVDHCFYARDVCFQTKSEVEGCVKSTGEAPATGGASRSSATILVATLAFMAPALATAFSAAGGYVDHMAEVPRERDR